MARFALFSRLFLDFYPLIFTKSQSRVGLYSELLPQVKAVLEGEEDLIAKQANLCAMIKEVLNFLWVGFYRVIDQQLILGPYQGPLACSRIEFGKGVCGAAWKLKETIIVPNVNEFEGHIACSSLSQSEIVVPFFDSKRNVISLLDIDSAQLNDFGPTDQQALEEMRNYF
ncbi:GAF domain-containing protein [bacterium]|nr:GAF domain-containing protein [bacterium]